MPVMLLSFKKGRNGHIMFHGFLAPSEREAEKDLKAHAEICPQFGPAHRAGETIDEVVELDTLPDPDDFSEDTIGEFVDDLFGLEVDEDEQEEEEPETPEPGED